MGALLWWAKLSCTPSKGHRGPHSAGAIVQIFKGTARAQRGSHDGYYCPGKALGPRASLQRWWVCPQPPLPLQLQTSPWLSL